MAPHADSAGSKAGATPATATTSTSSDRFHSATSSAAIEAETRFAAHNYHPLPVVFARASGVDVWDPEGRQYLDFLSAYSAVNQGHCHPELVRALAEQAGRLTLSSRAFHNDVFPRWAEKMQRVFGYDMVLPMNTGAEAVETAVKIARKWAYKVKGVPQGKAIVIGVDGNFHGRTMTAISLSTDPESRDNYGPYVPNIGAVCPAAGASSGGTDRLVRFNNIPDLERALAEHGAHAAALIVEPIQGEAGVVVPDDDYLARAAALCRKHRVLLVADEIQTGVARTGKMLCSEWSFPGMLGKGEGGEAAAVGAGAGEWEGPGEARLKPDLVTLGKAVSGGMYPVSCVLGARDVMLVVEPGTHGSTYGGNPLGCAVSIRALELVEEEGMVDRAERLGNMFRDHVEAMGSDVVKSVRGKGLLNAVVIDETKTQGRTAWDLCILLKEAGLLAKPTHGNIIRFAPPLVISEPQLRRALSILADALQALPSAKKAATH